MTPPDGLRDRPRALILGDDPINALGVARNLGRTGVAVHRLGAIDDRVLRSRYIRSTEVVPEIDACSELDYVVHLRRAALRIGEGAVVFPISDLHVLRVARNAGELSRCFRLLASSVSATETLVNKRLFFESLRGSAVPHPSTRFPRERGEFAEAAEQIGYPVYLKPEISPLFARKFQRKGFVANDRAELSRHLDEIETSGLRVMLQEIVPGDARCMHGCAGFKSVNAFLTFCYRRVREFPAGFGCGSLLESVPSFAAETGLSGYLDGIGYAGIFDAEFKRDPRDGRFKLIEINARSWWQNMHPTSSGLNVIEAAYRHATGRPVEGGDYRVGTKWIHLYNDFQASRAAGMGSVEWIRSLRGERSFDIWAGDDPRPMVRYVSRLVGRKLAALLGARSPR